MCFCCGITHRIDETVQMGIPLDMQLQIYCVLLPSTKLFFSFNFWNQKQIHTELHQTLQITSDFGLNVFQVIVFLVCNFSALIHSAALLVILIREP